MTDDDAPGLESTAGLSRVILAALEQTRSPACITTADLEPPGPTIVYVNPAYLEMTGRRRENVIGRSPRIMQGPLTDRSVLDRLRSNLESGNRFTGETVNYRADGTPFIINWSIDPVRNDVGAITHFVATQEDVTANVRLARLMSAERELDEMLTRALTVVGDERAAFEAMVESIARGAGIIAAMGSSSGSIRDDATGDSVSWGNTELDRNCAAFDFARPTSMIRGTITVSDLDDAEMAFLDRNGLDRYARHAAAVTSALAEYQRQRRTALQLQTDLLPRENLSASGFEVVTRYLPGSAALQVGGDWFDVVDTGPHALFMVGDVSGSGVEAAALMGRLRLLARTAFERGSDVLSVVRLLDDACADDERMATLLVAEFDRSEESVTIWSAGHLPPLGLMGRGRQDHMVSVRVAPPLGHLDGLAPAPSRHRLAEGEGLLLYTDGLIERRTESLSASLARLETSVPDVEDLAQAVDELLLTLGSELDDDVAVLACLRSRAR